MLLKNEIEVHKESLEYIKNTFSQYTLSNEPLATVNDPILHLYAVKDTYDEDGSLNGYTDSLFMRVDIYDTKKMLVNKGNRLHDSLDIFDRVHVSQIKIFNDLSTLVSLKGTYGIDTKYQAMHIEMKWYEG